MSSIKRKRILAWFSLLLIFGAGAGAGVAGARLYTEDYLREAVRSEGKSLEDLLWRKLQNELEAPDSVEAEFRQLVRQSVYQMKVVRLRNRSELIPAIKRIVGKLQTMIPEANREKLDRNVRSIQIYSTAPFNAALYLAIDASNEDIYTIDTMLSKEYDSLKGDEPLAPERLSTFGRELAVRKLPEIRAALSPEKQKKLDALGPGLENLKELSVSETVRALKLNE